MATRTSPGRRPRPTSRPFAVRTEEGWQGGDSDAFVSVLASDLGALGLSASPLLGMPPVAVELDGSAPTGSTPTSWSWDVDDDGSIDTTGQSVVWTYDTPGTYSIRLEVAFGPFTPSVVLEDALLLFDESSALRFDGGAERAVCPAAPALNLKGDLTLAAWIDPYDWGGFPFAQMGLGQIINKGAISLQVVGVHAQFNDNALCLTLAHGDGTTSVSMTPAGSVALDEWQHVAATYDTTASTVRMWIDGVEQTVSHTVAPSGGIADNAADDLLVGNIAALNKGFEGVIDEVSVWTRGARARRHRVGPRLPALRRRTRSRRLLANGRGRRRRAGGRVGGRQRRHSSGGRLGPGRGPPRDGS